MHELIGLLFFSTVSKIPTVQSPTEILFLPIGPYDTSGLLYSSSISESAASINRHPVAKYSAIKECAVVGAKQKK